MHVASRSTTRTCRHRVVTALALCVSCAPGKWATRCPRLRACPTRVRCPYTTPWRGCGPSCTPSPAPSTPSPPRLVTTRGCICFGFEIMFMERLQWSSRTRRSERSCSSTVWLVGKFENVHLKFNRGCCVRRACAGGAPGAWSHLQTRSGVCRTELSRRGSGSVHRSGTTVAVAPSDSWHVINTFYGCGGGPALVHALQATTYGCGPTT